jgi:hypothetical protein
VTRLHCTYHCGGCHTHFASLEAFDLHRAGDHATRRRCLDPNDEPRLSEVGRGVCRVYVVENLNVVVWTSTRAIGRAGKAFATRAERSAESERQPGMAQHALDLGVAA